jgi:Arm DNA-binding domain
VARVVGKLSPLQISRLFKRGMYNDGGGLYPQIAEGGSKSWLFRCKVAGKDRWHGLGPLHTISLAQARAKAADARRLKLDGHDPIEAKRASRAAARLDAARAITFKAAAARYIKDNRAGWKNVKHADQWTSTLETYAYPLIGQLPVQAIDTALVMKVLDPIWTVKNETASRVRGRIESVINAAKARGEFQGENPARWRGHLETLLPKSSKVRKVQNQPALPYVQLPGFMAELRANAGLGQLLR